MSNILPIPDFFDPGKLDQVWRVLYEERAGQARDWALQHGIQPASPMGTMSADQANTWLLLVDVQNTFCIPGF